MAVMVLLSLIRELDLPSAFAVEVEEFVIDMPAFTDGRAVVNDACDAAGAEPFDIADIGHFNSGLDAVIKDLEPYRPRRHSANIKNSKHINCLSHSCMNEILSSRQLYDNRTSVLFQYRSRSLIICCTAEMPAARPAIQPAIQSAARPAVEEIRNERKSFP